MHTLALTVMIGSIIMCSWAGAQETWIVNGKSVDTKGEALVAKAKDENAVVVRCVAQEMTPKGTLKAKKVTR